MTGLLQINLEKKVIKVTLGPEGLESDRKDFSVVLSVFCMLTFICLLQVGFFHMVGDIAVCDSGLTSSQLYHQRVSVKKIPEENVLLTLGLLSHYS